MPARRSCTRRRRSRSCSRDLVTSGAPGTAADVSDGLGGRVRRVRRGGARRTELWTTSPERSRAFWNRSTTGCSRPRTCPRTTGCATSSTARSPTARTTRSSTTSRPPSRARRRRVPLGDRVELRGVARGPARLPRRPRPLRRARDLGRRGHREAGSADLPSWRSTARRSSRTRPSTSATTRSSTSIRPPSSACCRS